jgi:hypothetical protein
VNTESTAVTPGKTTDVKHLNSIIYISNNFLDSIHKFSMPERRVLWYLLRSYKFNDLSTVTMDLTINHGEYGKLFNISTSQASHELFTACHSFTDNSLYMPRPDWIGNVLDCLDDQILTSQEVSELAPFKTCNIVEACDFGIRKNESDILFTRSFMKIILPIKDDIFTQYRLLQAKGLTNALHVALYEEFRRWITKGVYNSTPTRLINKLQLPATYSSFSQMRRGFLEPALKLINERTDLQIKCVEERLEPDSPRSKVIGLAFNISKKEEFDTKLL